VKEMIKRNNLDNSVDLIPINQNTPKGDINSPILLMVGSIINHLKRLKDKKVNIIGSGNINGDIIKTLNLDVNIIGVRGELSKLSIIDKDVLVIGDPGLLLSEFFKTTKKPTKKTGYIIHSVDRDLFFEKHPKLKKYLINNYQSPDKFIDELLEYENIVSSSLHGIIFSHSFSKKVIPIKISDKITGGDFKFTDYYSSLGMKDINRICFSDYFNENYNKLKYDVDNEIINKLKLSQLDLISKFLIKNYG
jgi:pyruvyltransferase